MITTSNDDRRGLPARHDRLRGRNRRLRIGRAMHASRCRSSSTTRRAARTACCTATARPRHSCPRSSARKPFEMRHLSMESLYEYGSRAGFWRIMREFERRRIPVTIFGVSMALERNPEAVGRDARRPGTRSPVTAGAGSATSTWTRPPSASTCGSRSRSIRRMTGSAPLGWYTGRDSPNTRRLRGRARRLSLRRGFLRRRPAVLGRGRRPAAPGRALHTRLRTTCALRTAQGFNSGEQFFQYLKDAFDVLYAEGETRAQDDVGRAALPASRRPGRFAALCRFLDHVQRTTRYGSAGAWTSPGTGSSAILTAHTKLRRGPARSEQIQLTVDLRRLEPRRVERLSPPLIQAQPLTGDVEAFLQ